MQIKNKQIFKIIIILFFLHIIALSLLPLPDPSESRYASIASEMVNSGDYIMPQIWIKGKLIPFMSKPPFAFWMTALSIEIFGTNEFAVRIPSFTAGLLMLLLMYYILNRYKERDTALTAVIITATSGGYYLLSSAVLVDIWLCLFSIGAIFLYYGFLKENNRKRGKLLSLGIFIFLALGILTKGPVALIFFGLPVFTYTVLNADFSPLKKVTWFTGIPLFLLISLPWFILAEKHTPGYLHYFFINENFMRFVSPDKSLDLYSAISHAVPKGTAVAYTLLVCLPWTLFLPLFYSIKKGKVTALFEALKAELKRIKTNLFKKESFSLFTSGLVSITLFWCISSHLMPYYMVLTVPLFSVYAAEIFRKYNFKLEYILKISALLLFLYLIAYVPGFIFVDRYKSTKYITQKAVEILKDENISGKIVFVRRVKYSTYFYGGDLIVPHEKESVIDSFKKHFNINNLFVMKRKYWKRLPETVSKNLLILYKDKYWIIVKPKAPTIQTAFIH
jgi:4-amino-4-deoxy-L-arabinose transferase-like glycosyltransferase